MTEECWFCREDRGDDYPPGGWAYEDTRWRVWHALPTWGPVGTTIVESRRHFLDFTEMEPAEQQTFASLMGRVYAAIKSAVGADRVYSWSTMGGYPHLHVWLIPWWSESPKRGPRYLREALEGGGITEPEALATADHLRTTLSQSA